MATKLIWQCSHKGTMDNKEAAIRRYEEHIEEVKAEVPADQLLIFTVTEDWKPLCKSLEVDEPDTSFPNVNDRKEVNKTLPKFTKMAYGIIVGAVLILIATGYGISFLV